MPDEENMEETLVMENRQEKSELSNDQLDEAAGGSSVVRPTADTTDEDAQKIDNSGVRYAESQE